MLIKATRPFTEWTGEHMAVFNLDEEGELPDGFAIARIESGFAIEVGDQGDDTPADPPAKTPAKPKGKSSADESDEAPA